VGQGRLTLRRGLTLLCVALAFAALRSFIDYVGLMFFPDQVEDHMELFLGLLFSSGFMAAALYGIAKRSWSSFVFSIPLFGLGNYLAENTFFVWLSLLGDRTGMYGWYTGNPLNPDGRFGYGGTCVTAFIGPLDMAGYALLNAACYGVPFLALYLVNRYHPPR
jgi:hypothetical protein